MRLTRKGFWTCIEAVSVETVIGSVNVTGAHLESGGIY